MAANSYLAGSPCELRKPCRCPSTALAERLRSAAAAALSDSELSRTSIAAASAGADGSAPALMPWLIPAPDQRLPAYPAVVQADPQVLVVVPHQTGRALPMTQRPVEHPTKGLRNRRAELLDDLGTRPAE